MSNITVVPWGLHPLSPWVFTELKNRAKEYGQNPTPTENTPYSGPRTAWVRFFSNGISTLSTAQGKDGFVLGGAYGFNESYGFNQNGKITIGVDAKGHPHEIEKENSVSLAINRAGQATRTDFPHRPPPNVESVSCELNGSNSSFPNLCRKITINWKCYSLAQLNYLIPYFLTPRITCLVEWGWNNYDRISLVDLSDRDWINRMFVDPSYTLEYLKKSKGNYDAGLGFIVDFGYKMNDYGGYDCHTTLINANKLLEGEQIATKEVTIKKGSDYLSVQSFYSFAKENMKNIDSNEEQYKQIRQDLRIGKRSYETIVDDYGQEERVELDEVKDNISERVFRITNVPSQNKTKKLWLRMDLIQDIINAFFKLNMTGEKSAVIRELDIMETRMCGNPFLKSSNTNVLVPNKFAPRFAYELSTDVGTNEGYQPEDGIYTSLFQEKIQNVAKDYFLDSTNFDNLQEAINPKGESFPVYKDDELKDGDGNTAQKFKSGYWGFLKDLFVDEEYFRKLVLKHDSILKLIEELLQGINQALCQICQLRLIPAEYGNSKYSVYDGNLPGISAKVDARNLPIITLGAIDSSFIKAASFDVKMSSEMMNQLVMQSANPERDPDGSTQTKNVAANPIVSRYSNGDRLYEKGIIKTVVVAENTPKLTQRERDRAARERTAAAKRQLREQDRKLQSRSDKNSSTFVIYYKQDPNNPGKNLRYFICEKDASFLNYILKLPNKNSPYLNNAIMPGTTLTLELPGISGINYLSQFLIDHAPEPYNFENAVWQITDVKQNIEDKNWTTTLTAQVRPLTTL